MINIYDAEVWVRVCGVALPHLQWQPLYGQRPDEMAARACLSPHADSPRTYLTLVHSRLEEVRDVRVLLYDRGTTVEDTTTLPLTVQGVLTSLVRIKAKIRSLHSAANWASGGVYVPEHEGLGILEIPTSVEIHSLGRAIPAKKEGVDWSCFELINTPTIRPFLLNPDDTNLLDWDDDPA